MLTSDTSGSGKVYTYYKCINNKKYHTCDRKAVSKDKLEDAVAKAVMDKIMDDKLMDELAYTLYNLQNQETNRIFALKKQLDEVEQGINNMLDAIQSGVVLSSTKQRLADLEEKQKALTVAITEEEIKSPALTKEQILFGLHKFRKYDISKMESKEKLLSSFVNSVHLFEDYALITCNFKGATVKISLEDIENSDFGDVFKEQKNKPEQKSSDLSKFGEP